MKLMSMKQYMKMSKPALIRKITKALRAMPKKRLAVLYYNITKSKLLQLRKSKAWYDPPQNIKHLRAIGLSSKGYSTPITIPAKRKTKKIVGKIYYTKNGQPYKILKSGKARFMKK